MTVRAALLDENGVYLRMDELADASALTSRHLAQIRSCDLPPGEYAWISDGKNPEGGAFWSVKWLERIEATRREVARAERRARTMAEIRKLPSGERRAARAAARARRS